MKIISFIDEPQLIRRVLEQLKLWQERIPKVLPPPAGKGVGPTTETPDITSFHPILGHILPLDGPFRPKNEVGKTHNFTVPHFHPQRIKDLNTPFRTQNQPSKAYLMLRNDFFFNDLVNLRWSDPKVLSVDRGMRSGY